MSHEDARGQPQAERAEGKGRDTGAVRGPSWLTQSAKKDRRPG